MSREMLCWPLFMNSFIFPGYLVPDLFIKCFRACSAFFWHFLIKIFCSQSRALFLHKGYMLLSFFIHFLFRPRQFTALIEHVPWASQSRKWALSIFLFSLCTTAGTQEFNFEQLTFTELLHRLKSCLQLTCSLIGTNDQEHNKNMQQNL